MYLAPNFRKFCPDLLQRHLVIAQQAHQPARPLNMNPYNYHGTDGSHNPENDRDIHDGMEPPNSTPSRPPVASHLTQVAPCLASATQSHLPYDLYYTSVGQQNGLHHGFNGPGQAHGMIHAEMPQSLSAQQALWRNHNAQWVGRSQQAATPFLSMAPSIPANAYAQTSMPTMGPMTAAIDSGNHPQPLQQRGMSQPWSRAQDDLLLTLKMEGKTHADICSALQRRFGVLRTPNVVAKRLTKLHNEVLSREVSTSIYFGKDKENRQKPVPDRYKAQVSVANLSWILRMWGNALRTFWRRPSL